MNRPDDLSPTADTRTSAAPFSVRRITVSDAEGLAAMMADPEVFPWLLQLPYASAEHWRARLGDIVAPGKTDVMLVAAGPDGQVIGSAGLHPVGTTQRRRHVMGLGMQVHPVWQRQGVGTRLMQALCDYADNWIGLLRIELDVYTDNHRAQALYRRFGFVDEGVHRCHALRDGVYIDSLSMARLNPAPLRGFPRQQAGSAASGMRKC